MATIVIEIPDALKPIVEPSMRAYVDAVEQQVRAGEARRRVDYLSLIHI